MIGIFGGTFDPVHYGHIKPALSVKHALQLEQLRFIPNREPPHRETPWLEVDQRLSLLKTALAEYEDVVVDERELEREGPSYMVDTLLSLKQDFPQQCFCLIIGMDAFMGINHWHRWRQLFELCHIVVTQRPGFDESVVTTKMDADEADFLKQKITRNISDLSLQPTGKILLQSVPQLDISSTMIRESLSRGEDISQWMPAAAYTQLRGLVNDN